MKPAGWWNCQRRAEALLTSSARPIVLAPARMELDGVAPQNHELGLMLPYTPLHHLLFTAGAPDVLVMTSANRSSEPIAYDDEDALQRLSGIADAFLIGQRPIARRVDDSVVRDGAFGPVILRRARGYAPGAVAKLPVAAADSGAGRRLEKHRHAGGGRPGFCQPAHRRPGTLRSFPRISAKPFRPGVDVRGAIGMNCWWYTMPIRSTLPCSMPGTCRFRTGSQCSITAPMSRLCWPSAVQWEKRVLGVSFDGTGYGDDGTIWGGEIFVGSIAEGFDRVAHLRNAEASGRRCCSAVPGAGCGRLSGATR